MRKSKVVAAILVLAMMASMMAPAMAATPRAQELAEMLYAADLFRGYGKDAAGQPIFGLDDTATRAESLVMLVRMLGKEGEAKNTSYTTPLSDIPDWCKNEIGYGYTAGLTSGTSETTFSPTKTVTNTEFLVFALRALGYESGADYEWAKAAVKAAELGVITTGEYADSKNTFTRGDMVIVAYGALTTKVKGSDKTLAETLGLDLKPAQKPVPGTGTGNPIVDATVKTLDIYAPEFDGWLDAPSDYGYPGDKAINIGSLPDGTIIKDIGEGRDTSKTFEESLDVFLANLYKIDHEVQYKGTRFYGRGKDVILSKCEGTRFKGSEVILVGTRFFKDESFNRILIINSMSYFGDKGMASKVYAMMSDHYKTRKDNDKIISPEFAAKYGLTIQHDFSYMTSLKDAAGKVSDGTHTWGVNYNTTNLECRDQAVSFSVEIPMN